MESPQIMSHSWFISVVDSVDVGAMEPWCFLMVDFGVTRRVRPHCKQTLQQLAPPLYKLLNQLCHCDFLQDLDFPIKLKYSLFYDWKHHF